jgi:hypothetical protein
MPDHAEISRRRFLQGAVAGGLTLSPLMSEAEARTSPASSLSGGLTLRVDGDAQRGYSVLVLHDDQPVARHAGEFSALFQNPDRSLEDRVENWKAASWAGNHTHVTLDGACKLKNVNTTAYARVEYDVLTSQVVRKRVRLQQSDIYMLYYQLSNRLEALAPPAKFWSFDQPGCRGGSLHEYYPAAGFRTASGLTFGLLTDSGNRNGWTRLIRHDGHPTKPAPRSIPDANLYYVCSPDDRAKGRFFVQQTFGEAVVQLDRVSAEIITLPPPRMWMKRGSAGLEELPDSARVTLRSSEDAIMLPFAAGNGEVYSLGFEYHSAQPFAAQIWALDNQIRKIENVSLYNDVVPASPEDWSQFRTTVYFFSSLADRGAIFIALPQSEQATERGLTGGAQQVELRNLRLERLRTRSEPYHQLLMDQAQEKTMFVFAEPQLPDTIRGYRLASQTHLADALGFRGRDTEKVLYADLMMLCWIASGDSFRPMCAPSIWYSAAGEMYLRDSFFALNGIHNRDLNESVFNLWGANQGPNGAINTLVEPNYANVERKSNDSTPLWLIWALQNRRRFGARLPMDKVRAAAEYCLSTYDPLGTGICRAQFVMGQLDVIDYPNGTSEIAENQGTWADPARDQGARDSRDQRERIRRPAEKRRSGVWQLLRSAEEVLEAGTLHHRRGRLRRDLP